MDPSINGLWFILNSVLISISAGYSHHYGMSLTIAGLLAYLGYHWISYIIRYLDYSNLHVYIYMTLILRLDMSIFNYDIDPISSLSSFKPSLRDS